MSVSIKAPDENPSNVESILSDTIGLPGYTINPPGSRIEELLIELNELIKSGGDSDAYATDLSLTIDSSTYVITAVLKNKDGESIGTPQTIDLPMESVVVSGSYNSQTKKVVLTLQNGSTVEFSVADLIDGLQAEITSTNKLNADLVDDSTSTNKFVTNADKSAWDSKQNAIDNNHKLDADLIDDTNATNKFATAAQLQQIETNKTNISNIQTSLSSTSSDVGKVLTADGEGGYAWQPASGGGTTKYLYQFTVGWGCRTTSVPILGYALRFCVSFVSDDGNLAVTGIVDYNTFITKYIKFSNNTGYAWAVNVNSAFISDGSSGAIASIPVSTVRINWDNGHWLFRTSDGEMELEKGIGNPNVSGTKTEI